MCSLSEEHSIKIKFVVSHIGAALIGAILMGLTTSQHHKQRMDPRSDTLNLLTNSLSASFGVTKDRANFFTIQIDSSRFTQVPTLSMGSDDIRPDIQIKPNSAKAIQAILGLQTEYGRCKWHQSPIAAILSKQKVTIFGSVTMLEELSPVTNPLLNGKLLLLPVQDRSPPCDRTPQVMYGEIK